MLKAFIVLGLVLVSGVLNAEETPVGTSRFKLEMPKPETRTIVSARYVLGSDQELTGLCPGDTKLVSVGCDAVARSMGERLSLNDWSERWYPVTGSVLSDVSGTARAKCSVPFVRADDVVKVSMSIKCKDTQPNMAAK